MQLIKNRENIVYPSYNSAEVLKFKGQNIGKSKGFKNFKIKKGQNYNAVSKIHKIIA